ncbi:MAG: hypothetical protein QXU18_06070 [Thermoplasmatales archaeon]
MLIPVAKNVFKWKSNDPELGIEQVGHVLISSGNSVAIDPPMVPGLADALKVISKPQAVIITNFSHVRGCAALARALGVDLYIPELVGTERRKPQDEIRYHHLESALKYGPDSKLPIGMKAYKMRPETGRNEPVLDEMILHFENFLITGDSAWGIDGKITLFPGHIMPDPDGSKKKAVQERLERLVKDTGAGSLLSGHMDDLIGSLGNQL